MCTCLLKETQFIKFPDDEVKVDMNSKNNLILITIDCLRPDHLSFNGYSKNASPNIDELAKKNIIFNKTFSQSSWTLPSMTSIFTSFYPYLYNDTYREELLLDSESIITFPEILEENDYKTAGFVDACYMNSFFGFDKRFNLYDDRGCLHPNFWSSEKLNDRMFEFLQKNLQNKFFIYLHYMEVHSYRQNTTKYDENILIVDKQIGRILRKLDQLNLTQKTIIIITADHGEELLERGGLGHGETLYDEVIHVPLIIKIPSIEHRTINNQVESIDITPTILNLLNIPIPEQFQGESLIPLIMGYEKEDKTVYSKLKTLVSVRRNDFKLIYDTKTNESELYDLRKDPKERINLAKENLLITEELKDELIKWLETLKEKALYFNISITEYQYPKIILPLVNVDESSLSIVSSNPDIIYTREKWPQDDGCFFYELPQHFWGSWYSDGYYYNNPIPQNSNNKGIVIIHPFNPSKPRFLAQNISLIDDVHVLVVEIGNVVGHFNVSCGNSDAIFKIKVLDIDKKTEATVYEDIVKESDGWKTVAIVMHPYSGRNITFKVEGHAGGPDSIWCGEYAAVNKFYIAKTTKELKSTEEKIEEKLKELGYIE